MDNIIVKDTMEVYLKDLSDATKTYFFGITSKADWASKIKNELLKGGIGNFTQGILFSEREEEFNVTPLYFSDSIVGIQHGVAPTSGSTDVMTNENLKVGVGGTGKVTLVGTPKTGTTTMEVFDAQGKKYTGTYATGVTTIATPPVDGTYVTVVYPQTVTANIIDLRADTIPKNYMIWAKTICYNPDTNAVVQDIYLNFLKAVPTGEINNAFEAKNQGMPINFLCMCPLGTKSFGSYITVARA